MHCRALHPYLHLLAAWLAPNIYPVQRYCAVPLTPCRSSNRKLDSICPSLRNLTLPFPKITNSTQTSLFPSSRLFCWGHFFFLVLETCAFCVALISPKCCGLQCLGFREPAEPCTPYHWRLETEKKLPTICSRTRIPFRIPTRATRLGQGGKQNTRLQFFVAGDAR